MQKPEIQSIDHIVMQAVNLAATIKFYTEILGMEHSSFSRQQGGRCANLCILDCKRSIYMMRHRLLFRMPKIRWQAVLIYVSSQRSRLPIGKRILPIMALILKMDRFAKPAQTARFCQFIFVTPTII